MTYKKIIVQQSTIRLPLHRALFISFI